jgi:L-serine deaminase
MQAMITKEEAQKKTESIRDICRKVYDNGLKGEDVIGPLSDIYQQAYELSDYIEQTKPATQPAPTQTTGA